MSLNLFRFVRPGAFVALCLLTLTAVGQPASRRVAASGKTPLRFEPNQGQLEGGNHTGGGFFARGSQYLLSLQPASATIVLNRSVDQAEPGKGGSRTTQEVVRMTLLGANSTAAMRGEEALPGYVNYLSGLDGRGNHTAIPTFAGTRTQSVYPGVDLTFHGSSERQLEYDFVVAPDADASVIRLHFDGVAPVVESTGDLRLQTTSEPRSTDLRMGKPFVYQTDAQGVRHQVLGEFVLASNGEVSFGLGAYDHARELVIDPIVDWASYFGGTGTADNTVVIYASTLNSANQMYAVGYTNSVALPAATGSLQPTSTGKYQHAFVTKFSADGSTVLWTTYLTGGQSEAAYGVAVNSADQTYVVGYTQSSDFPFTSDRVQPLCNPEGDKFDYNAGVYTTEKNACEDHQDAFLVKLSADGKTELYGTSLGGSNADEANAVTLDAAGNVYLAGETLSTGYASGNATTKCGSLPEYPGRPGTANFPTTANAFYTNITLGQLNGIYDAGCKDYYYNSTPQAFVVKLSPDMHTLLYSSLIGGVNLGNCGNGACSTYGQAIAVNASGLVYVSGQTSSGTWPVTSGAFAPACQKNNQANCALNGWLAAFDPSKSGSASLAFTTYVNGTGPATSQGGTNFPTSTAGSLTTDSAGNVLVAGGTSSNTFPTTVGAYQTACVSSDARPCDAGYLAKVSPTGALVWSTYLGTTAVDFDGTYIAGVALDSKDNPYFIAHANDNLLPVRNNLPGYFANGTYIGQFSADGSTLLYGSYLGEGSSNLNSNPKLDTNGNLYFSGNAPCNGCGGTFTATPGAAITSPTTQNVGILLKAYPKQFVSTTLLGVSPSSAAPGAAVAFNVTVTGDATAPTVTGLPNTATPNGTVTLTYPDAKNVTQTLATLTLSSGKASFSTTALAQGTYAVTANFTTNDGLYTATSSTPQTVSVVTMPTVTLAANPTAGKPDTKFVFTATVAASSGSPTGTVYFMDGTAMLGSTAVAAGSATYSVTLATGTHAITARYGGDANFATATSAAQSVTVTTYSSSTTLTGSAATAVQGIQLTFNSAVTATGTALVPTGTVTFLDGTAMLGTSALKNGAASLSTASLAAGSHSITASYGGDANFASSVSAATIVTVTAPSVSLTATPASLTLSSGASGNAIITATPTGVLTGTVSFSCGSVPQHAMCSFSPATLTFNASSAAQTSTLSLATNIAALHPADLPFPGRRTEKTFAVLLLPAGLFTMLRRRRRSAVAVILLTVFGMLAVLNVSGCGSGTTFNSTAPGTYSITVNATINGGTTSLPINVTVQ